MFIWSKYTNSNLIKASSIFGCLQNKLFTGLEELPARAPHFPMQNSANRTSRMDSGSILPVSLPRECAADRSSSAANSCSLCTLLYRLRAATQSPSNRRWRCRAMRTWLCIWLMMLSVCISRLTAACTLDGSQTEGVLSVSIFWPKYWSGHPGNWFFSLSKISFLDISIQNIFYLILKTGALSIIWPQNIRTNKLFMSVFKHLLNSSVQNQDVIVFTSILLSNAMGTPSRTITGPDTLHDG